MGSVRVITLIYYGESGVKREVARQAARQRRAEAGGDVSAERRKDLFAPDIDHLLDIGPERHANTHLSDLVLRRQGKEFSNPLDALPWSAGDD